MGRGLRTRQIWYSIPLHLGFPQAQLSHLCKRGGKPRQTFRACDSGYEGTAKRGLGKRPPWLVIQTERSGSWWESLMGWGKPEGPAAVPQPDNER